MTIRRFARLAYAVGSVEEGAPPGVVAGALEWAVLEPVYRGKEEWCCLGARWRCDRGGKTATERGTERERERERVRERESGWERRRMRTRMPPSARRSARCGSCPPWSISHRRFGCSSSSEESLRMCAHHSLSPHCSPALLLRSIDWGEVAVFSHTRCVAVWLTVLSGTLCCRAGSGVPVSCTGSRSSAAGSARKPTAGRAALSAAPA